MIAVRMLCVTFFLCFVTVTMSLNAHAVTVCIGDPDGFGYTNLSSLYGFDGLPAERNGTGMLDSGDVLPDIDQDGHTWLSSGLYADLFDNRSTQEKASLTDERWTDVSLSCYFTDAYYEGQHYQTPGYPDDVSFTFTFTVPGSEDPDFGQDHYISFVYGDYDVVPMTATIEEDPVTLQGNIIGGTYYDGLIWRAYHKVLWEDMLDGSVTIEIDAPNEPFVAFDYALLSTEPIQVVPIPATFLLMISGLVGFVGIRRRYRQI